jgi:2,3-diketo-5-methylthiopentyl-1-phosphate enolase
MYMDPLFFQMPEGIDKEKYVIATYLIGVEREVEALKYVAALAVEQTTGTWTNVPGETPEVRERHLGRLVGLYEVPPYPLAYPKDIEERYFIARIAFPADNFGPSFSMLLTTIFGNISTIDRIKLMDVEFPDSYLKHFKGPKFGVEGLRELLGVHDRPLVNNMIKPCIGLNPEQTAELAYQVALGGVDIIKDDELTANPPNCPLIERVKAVSAALEKADEEKGEKTLYAFNITDKAENLRENALRAIEAGAKCLMVNTWTIGLDACRMLTSDPDINVPILSHPDLQGAFYVSPYNGMKAPLVKAKFPRLAGLDMFIMPAPYGKFPVTWDNYIELAYTGLAPWKHIKRMMPMPGGGATPGVIQAMMETFGNDIIISAGGGIIGHPDGPTAGGKAFRQGIDAVMKGMTLREAANEPENKELKVALDKWGVVGEGKKLYDLKS